MERTYKTYDKLDNHNELGWKQSQQWLRSGEKAIEENDKSSFIIFLNMRDREEFYLSENEIENKVLPVFNRGIEKFKLGAK